MESSVACGKVISVDEGRLQKWTHPIIAAVLGATHLLWGATY